MPIVVACPGCGTQAGVRESHLGKSIQCPKCAQVLRPEMPANLPEEAVPEVQPTELLPEEEDAGDRARLRRRRQGEDEVEEEVEEVDEDGEPVKRRRSAASRPTHRVPAAAPAVPPA